MLYYNTKVKKVLSQAEKEEAAQIETDAQAVEKACGEVRVT
jgi:hypothetical protein